MTTKALLDDWKKKAVHDADLQNELDNLTRKEDIHDRFYRSLEFGTGGLRGEIGAGTNRMNIYTVRQATQGLAEYIKQTGKTKRAAIAYDSRIKSELFARSTAEVLAANGITAFIYPRLTPTPSLSFALRELLCDAGIVITASHNPAKYNGYKVYGSDGCQITTAAAKNILNEINGVDIFDGVRHKDFNEALEFGEIQYIDESVLDAYIGAVLNERVSDLKESLKLVYTPLNGAGLECVTRTLTAAGYDDLTVVEEQRLPDGRFPTCSYPNPEIKDAMQIGVKLCVDINADLLLATDPDCDRVGIAVNENGSCRLMTGNEVGVLLFDYICQTKKMAEKPVAVKTIVTTSLASRIAHTYGVELIDVLTGFKYIGEQIGFLENKNEHNRFIFGFEESCGYLSGTHVRDKDAVNASLLICDMVAWYKAQGLTLTQALEKLYEKFGYFSSSLDSFDFPGETGFLKMEGFMSELRANPPSMFAEHKVIEVRDYLHDTLETANKLPSSNVIQLFIDGSSIITIRPSGTEPKLKVYCETIKESKEESSATIIELRDKINAFLSAHGSP